jgi:hypothetical protein
MEAILIAPCGMDCGLCSSYLSLKNDLKRTGIMKTYCAGCRPRDKQCSFIKKRCQLVMSGELEYCYECSKFPCANLVRLDKRYNENFHMGMIENLNFIKENGVEEFLEKEKEKWRCPECGGVICCHNGICYSCELAKLKAKKKMYQWED